MKDRNGDFTGQSTAPISYEDIPLIGENTCNMEIPDSSYKDAVANTSHYSMM